MPENTEIDKETEVVDPSLADEKQEDTTSSDGAKPESKQDEKAPEDLGKEFDRIGQEILDEATGKKSETSADGKKDEKSDPKLGLDKEKEDGTQKEEGTEKEDETDKGPVPYERFHEKVTQLNEFSEKVKTWEPMVQNYQGITKFLSEAGVTQEEFEKGMQILAALKNDPVQAKKLMEPYWDQVNTIDGSKLPQDLQKLVDDGEVPLPVAKELATLRAGQQISQNRQAKSQQQLEAERIGHFKQTATESLKGWIDTKQKNDPDFTAKKDGDADGKFEMWMLYMGQRLQNAQTVQDVVKACEESYAQVSKTVSRFVPKPKPTSRQLSSSRSSGKAKESAETMEDMIADIANSHGISVEASQLK